jgi:hypothetical protein
VSAIVLSDFVSQKYGINVGKYVPSRDAFWFYVWVLAVCVAGFYGLLTIIIGTDRTESLLSDLVEKMVKVYRSVSPNRR